MYASILHSTLKSQVRRCISYHFLAVLAVTGLRLGNRTARLQQKKQKQNNTQCTFVTSVIYTWHKQPTWQELDRFGWHLTVYLGVWRRIDGVLNAQLSDRHAHLWTTPLNHWRFPITDTLVPRNEPLSIQQMSMLSLNNFLNKDGATHYEIFRTQFSCSIRLWKDP